MKQNLKNVLNFEAELYVFLEVHYSTFALYLKNYSQTWK